MKLINYNLHTCPDCGEKKLSKSASLRHNHGDTSHKMECTDITSAARGHTYARIGRETDVDIANPMRFDTEEEREKAKDKIRNIFEKVTFIETERDKYGWFSGKEYRLKLFYGPGLLEESARQVFDEALLEDKENENNETND